MFASYMINAWISATIVAAVAGVVGFFVVVRGSTFAAHALPLGSFPGAAVANLLGLNPLAGMLVFSGLGVIGISQLGRHGRQEVATALSLVTLLGLGALFLSLSRAYSQATYALLFGQVLGVSNGDLAPVIVVSAVSILLTLVLFRPLLLSSLSPELAEAQGISARWMEITFLSIVALATSVALPVVGALLVFTLMVGPASAARALTARPGRAISLSVVLSVLTAWAAIALSFVTNWPIGFFVGSIGALAYALGRFVGRQQLARRTDRCHHGLP